jgi:glycosyltransferase domain-containing protein
LLGYFSDCRIAHQIIIADGSSEEIKKKNRETASSFPALKVLHLHHYSPETSFGDRLFDALKHVNTKYCVICADDDFITPNGIDQSVDFLESNSDFSVAHGRYIFFNLDDEEKGESRFLWRTLYSDESITSIDPAIRVNQQLSKYSTPTFYAVHKTEFLQMIWEETLKYTENMDILFEELLSSALDLVYGKMMCLDVLYSVKDLGRTRVAYIHTFQDYQEKGTYKKQYFKFRECLSTHLSRQSQISLKKAKKVVDQAMKAYMKKHYPSLPLNEVIQRMVDRMKIPGWLRKILRKPYELVIKVEPVEKETFDLPSSLKNDKEIEKITQRVLSSIQPSAT